MNLPPPQRGPRHYVIVRQGVVCSVQMYGKWRIYLSKSEAVEAVRESDYPQSTSIVDVGSPGPAGLAKRFR